MHLTIYVNDIPIVRANKQYMCEMKATYYNSFDKTDMGELEHFLYVYSSYRTTKYMLLDQAVYELKVLDMFATHLGPTKKTRMYLAYVFLIPSGFFLT